jgi:hypothetical protein
MMCGLGLGVGKLHLDCIAKNPSALERWGVGFQVSGQGKIFPACVPQLRPVLVDED